MLVMDEKRRRWFELTTSTLETIAELCQGNQRNQEEALGKRVVSTISGIVAWDPTEYDLLYETTKLKQSALLVIESMLELSNAKARDIAASVASNLNQEELYLAMNRFYYMALFERMMLQENMVKDVTGTGKGKGGAREHAAECEAASRECYYIIRRMQDLTGNDSSWDLGSSGNVREEPNFRKKVSDFYEERDEEVWGRFKEVVKKKDADPPGKPVRQSLPTRERTTARAEQQRAEVRRWYTTFANKALSELDDHGGEILDRDICDRVEILRARTISIEFVRKVDTSDEVQKIYFETPLEVQRLDKAEQAKMTDLLSLDSPQDKVRTLLDMFRKKRHRLQWEATLLSKWYLIPFSNRYVFLHFFFSRAS